VHHGPGPMNRCFYFLCQGASSSSTSNTYSSYLPGGMTGIGNTAGAKTACLKAATDLYGSTSAQYTAVSNAFKAINR